MILTYINKSYRISYDAVSMVENALDNPNLIQISVIQGCIIQVAPNNYGINYLPNGDFQNWTLTGLNTSLVRKEEHYIYARLHRGEREALLLFSVNNYSFDGSIIGGTSEPSKDYYYIKLGKITETDATTGATKKREISYDGGYLNTPQGNEEDAAGWKKLFALTANNLINALKHFASFTVEGTLTIIGRIMLNEKEIIDIAREKDEKAVIDDATLPTTKYLEVTFLKWLRQFLLSRDRPDQTNFLIKFLGGSQFGDFAPGILTGYGGLIDKKGNSELESLIVRRFIETPELRFNRVDIVVGDKWRSPGAGVMESVDTTTQVATLKLLEGEIGAVKEGDICMGIFHSETESDNSTEDTDDSKGNRTYAGFYTVYFTIVEVYGDKNSSFKYQLRPESQNWKLKYHPTEAMQFVAYGNFTDEERQTSVYETRTYTRMLVHQNTWEITAQNIAMQYGDMTNMSLHGADMSGYSTYLKDVYFTGKLNQVKPDGTPIRTANDRGKWVKGTKYDFYDRVSHNDGIWLCINEDGTELEPTDINSDWLKELESGKSIVYYDHWETWKTPIPRLGMVRMGNKQWLAKVETSNPPLWCLTDGNGSRLTQTQDGGKTWGYLLTGEENRAEWDIVVEDGKDGIDGIDGQVGDQGIAGCILRKAEWVYNVEWRNDEELKSGTRYVDIALVRDNSMATGWKAYKCVKTHTSSVDNAPGHTAFWEEFAVNTTAIFTSLIVAKNAQIDFMQGNQLLIKKENDTVTAGMSGAQSGKKTRIWAGSSDPDTAPSRIDESGHLVSTDADIKGKVTASSGSIGGFDIGNGRIGSIKDISSDGYSEGMSLYKDFIAFNSPNRQAIIGCFNSLGTDYLGRFIDSGYSLFNKYGLIFNVSGGPYNLAISGRGNVAMNGLVEGYSYNSESPQPNTVNIPTLSKGKYIMCFFFNDNSGVGLPKLKDVQETLSIGTSTPFCVRMTYVVGYSTKEGRLWGRNPNVPDMNTSQDAILRGNNYNNEVYLRMGSGDIIEVLLNYNGSTYDAALLNLRQ